MAGFRPTQCVIGIAGELVKGFTTTRSLERKPRRRADHGPGAAEAHRRGPARGPAPGRAGDHLGDGHAAGGRAAGPCRRDGRPDRRLPGHQPGRLQGPPRQDQHLQRLRSAGAPRRAAERGRAAGPGAAGDRGRAVRGGPRARQRAGPAGRRAVHRHRRRDDGRGPGPPRRHRGDAHVRPGRPGLHQVHRRPAGHAVPAGRGDRSWTTPAAWPCRRRDEVARIVADDVAIWAAGVELVMEELAGGRPAARPDLPVRRRLASAGDPARPARRGLLAAAAVQPDARGRGDGARPGGADRGRHRACWSTSRT